MSYRAHHDYDDDRDVITCVTLSDTRGRWPARSTPAAAVRRPSRWGRATDAGSCSSTASTTNPDGLGTIRDVADAVLHQLARLAVSSVVSAFSPPRPRRR